MHRNAALVIASAGMLWRKVARISGEMVPWVNRDDSMAGCLVLYAISVLRCECSDQSRRKKIIIEERNAQHLVPGEDE